MAWYRKRPVMIEAMEFTGGNIDQVAAFIGDTARTQGWQLRIDTLEGLMSVSAGDFVIRGVQGEFYPCKPDIFAATYERVE